MSICPDIHVFLTEYHESTHGNLKSRYDDCTDVHTDKTAIAVLMKARQGLERRVRESGDAKEEGRASTVENLFAQ